MPGVASAWMQQRTWRACSMLLVLLALAWQACSATPQAGESAWQDKPSAVQHAMLSKFRLSRRMAAAIHKHEASLFSIERGTLAGLAAVQAATRTVFEHHTTRQAVTPVQAELNASKAVQTSSSLKGDSKVLTAQQTLHHSRNSYKQKITKEPKHRSLLDGTGDAASSGSTTGATTSLPTDITNSDNSTPAAALKPWYNEHVLTPNGNQGLLYQALNFSATSTLDAGILATEAEEDDDAVTTAYDYPLATRYPTVFYTVIMQEYMWPVALNPAEMAAFSATVDNFLAASPDVLASNTSILVQAGNGMSGLYLPCSTAILTGDTTLQKFLASTLQGDPNLIFPTATWGKIRVVDVKEAMPVTPSSITYSWTIGDYGNCSVLCGGGVQTRPVVCMDSLGNVANPTACATVMPASSRSCQEQSCASSLPSNFTLVLGEWGPCNSSCGTGSRTRSATCISREGYVGSLLNCYAPEDIADLWQELWQPCTLPPCPTYYWAYSEWVCNNTAGCGGGTASRTPTCMQANTNREMDSYFCDPAELDTSTKLCASNPCHVYFWKSRELGDCLPEEESKPCGRYVQRRVFDCVNMTSDEIVAHFWCSGPKPELGDVECKAPVDCTEATAPPATMPLDSTLGSNVAGNSDSASSDSGSGGGEAHVPHSASPGGPADASGASNSSASNVPTNPDASSTPDSVSTTGTAASEAPLKPQPAGNMDSQGGFSASQSYEPAAEPALPTSNTIGIAASSPAPASSATSDNSISTKPQTSGSASSGSNSAAGSNTVPAASPKPQLGVTDPSSSTSGGGVTGFPSSYGGGGSSTSSMSSSGGGIAVSNTIASGTSTPLLDLGPGQELPAWLLEAPSPSLQTLLDCPKKYAVSVDGKCCGGKRLDSKGICCDGIVDACGICNGTGKAMDALGACCSGALDAQGVCCSSMIDECGVCNGTNACDLKAKLTASLPSATLYLIPNSNANRRLRTAIQDTVATAISATNGRPFDKMRVSVVLSAFTPTVHAKGNQRPAQADTVFGASEFNSVQYPQQMNLLPASWQSSSSSSGSGSHTNASNIAANTNIPVALNKAARQMDVLTGSNGSSGGVLQHAEGLAGAAAIAPLNTYNTYSVTTAPTASSSQQLVTQTPVQIDTMDQPNGLNTVQASTLQVNKTAGISVTEAAVANGTEASGWYQVERAAERILSTSFDGISKLVAGLTNSSKEVAVDTAAAQPQAASSNTIVIDIVLHTGLRVAGLDTGLALLSLNRLVDIPMGVPGSRGKLTVRKVISALRAGTCGDGVCQVNERKAYGNSDSCPSDCALPFLSCPLGKDNQQTCSNRGICYNGVGSCACTAGYSGTDCSSCALAHKMVNGYCVKAQLLAPPRAASVDITTGDQMLTQVLGARSLKSGMLAVTLTSILTVFVVLVASRAVYNYRMRQLVKHVETDLITRADMYLAE